MFRKNMLRIDKIVCEQCVTHGSFKERFMKSKFLTGISAAVLVLGLSGNAFAGCDGLYVGVRGGLINHNIGDNSENLGTRYDIDDNSLIAGIALGYRYGYLRTELEYTWREKTDHKMGSTMKSETESDSYMWNVYLDLSPYTMFTPYLMAGIGMTNIDLHDKFTSGQTTIRHSYSENNFTWALGGGLSAQVTTRINVDLGYRFWHMGDIEHASVRAHEFYLGARYVF